MGAVRHRAGPAAANAAAAAVPALRREASPLARPFEHLNLNRNPFGALPADLRERALVADVERWALRLSEPGFALLLLGEKGRGKSTHLLAIRARCLGATSTRIPPEGGVGASDIRPGRPTIIDECQRLSRWARRRVFRRGGSFAIASHLDHGRELERAGLVVERFHPGEELTEARLAAIFEGRIEAVRRGPGPVPRIRFETVAALRARFGTDLRAMERELYEVFQGLEGVCEI